MKPCGAQSEVAKSRIFIFLRTRILWRYFFRRMRRRACRAFRYSWMIARQTLFALLVGAICGLVGAAFLWSMRACSTAFERSVTHGLGNLIFLPGLGLLIVFMYRTTRQRLDAGVNQILEAAQQRGHASLWLAPLIFLSSSLTQVGGGSAGREGAALQLGGCLGLALARLERLTGVRLHVATLSGMAGGFAAVFGAPLSAAVFALEVACVGVLYYPALLATLTSATIAASIPRWLHLEWTSYPSLSATACGPTMAFKALALGLVCGLACQFFCITIRVWARVYARTFSNEYLRALFGALLVALGTWIVGDFSYNGTGQLLVERALSGQAHGYDFILKTLFTAATLAAGFKGGEIVPALAVGATLGCAAAPLWGIEPTFAAALAMTAVFGGATHCPLAALAMGVELFGAANALPFALACAASYVTSGHLGLYRSQRALFPLLDAERFDATDRRELLRYLRLMVERRDPEQIVKNESEGKKNR